MRIAAVLVVAAALVTPAVANDAVNPAPSSVPSSVPRHAATEGSVEALFAAFDLFGNWAADCGRPASLANPYVSVTMPSAGLVLEDNDVGPGYARNRYSVLSAIRLAADRLEVGVIFRPGAQGEERQKLIMLVRNGTRRTMFNRVEGGDIRVRHGIALASGTKTPVLKKCG